MTLFSASSRVRSGFAGVLFGLCLAVTVGRAQPIVLRQTNLAAAERTQSETRVLYASDERARNLDDVASRLSAPPAPAASEAETSGSASPPAANRDVRMAEGEGLAADGSVGLVAAFGFEEGTGSTTADASGNGNTGTISGATWTTQGRFGQALSFNGSSSRVSVAAAASLNLGAAMTLEGWIYPTAAQSGWRTILQRQTNAYFLNASNSTGPLRPSGGGTFGTTTTFVSGTTANPVNTWTHVAVTYDGAMLRLYVNGTQAASRPQTGTLQASTSPLWIGGNSPYGEVLPGHPRRHSHL